MSYGYRYVKAKPGEDKQTSYKILSVLGIGTSLLFILTTFIVIKTNLPLFRRPPATEGTTQLASKFGISVARQQNFDVSPFIFYEVATLREKLPSLIPNVLAKAFYTVAIIGDSMVDTMGERMDNLSLALKQRYPYTTFALYNYGIGSQNIVDGLARFETAFNYKSRHFPPLADLRPDVLIVGSFGYNPLANHDLGRYRQTLTTILARAKMASPRVYLIVEIAPLKKDFGKGPSGVNWPEEKALSQSAAISEQLEIATEVANSLHVPVINVFETTKNDPQNRRFVSSGDGIHPSVLGQQLTADRIASVIRFD